MADDTVITAELVRELLDYDPETGSLTWLPRDASVFRVVKASQESASNRWNSQHAWQKAGHLHSSGYLTLRIRNKAYRAHRIIWLWMTGSMPDREIDHVNSVKSDNRWTNLRLATRSQNGANKPVRRDSASGIKGLHIMECGKIIVWAGGIYIGRYYDIDKAKKAHADAMLRIYGEYARTE